MTQANHAQRLLAALMAGGPMLLGAGAAAADERVECAASAEQAQQLRDEGKYRRAREQMLSCARDACPGPIKSDCGKWLAELDRDAPTVVFGARDGKGVDQLDVKVSMDGAVLQERLDGKPVLVDSGEHTFKFESKSGLVREERVLLRAAEKARPIIATLAPEPSAAKPEDLRAPTEGSIVPSLVLGGVGVVALGSFAFFGLTGKSDVDDLERCKPDCTVDAVDAARTKLIVADLSLALGVLALGAATVLYFLRPVKTEAKATTTTGLGSLRFDGGPARGGALAGIGGRFE